MKGARRANECAGIDQDLPVLPNERQRRRCSALNVHTLGAGNFNHRSEIYVIQVYRAQGAIARKVPELIDNQLAAECLAFRVS